MMFSTPLRELKEKCNELNQKLLISEDVLKHIHLSNKYGLTEKGAIGLKGKSHKLSLYGVQLAKNNL